MFVFKKLTIIFAVSFFSINYLFAGWELEDQPWIEYNFDYDSEFSFSGTFEDYIYVEQDGYSLKAFLIKNDDTIYAQDEKGHVLTMKVSDKAWIDLLLANNANINISDKFGYTPLIYSIMAKNVERVRKLLAHNAFVNVRTSMGNTPLMIVIDFIDLYSDLNLIEQIIEMLLINNADVDAQNSNGDTALILAAKYGFINIIHLLLKYNANVNIQNDGKTAEDIAQETGDQNIANVLKEHRELKKMAALY